MIPRKSVTKLFFELSEYDQAAVVSAIIRDIQGTIGCHLNPTHDRQAEQRGRRIRAWDSWNIRRMSPWQTGAETS